jgi:hypothetical protein
VIKHGDVAVDLAGSDSAGLPRGVEERADPVLNLCQSHSLLQEVDLRAISKRNDTAFIALKDCWRDDQVKCGWECGSFPCAERYIGIKYERKREQPLLLKTFLRRPLAIGDIVVSGDKHDLDSCGEDGSGRLEL